MKELSREEIIAGLYQLGVKNGMDIAVHSSLSSLGYVAGGAVTVIEALKEVVGMEGSIFMPALRLSPELPLDEIDRKNGLLRKIRILSEDEPRSAMGLIADTFRLMPDTIVGEGVFAASAWGKQAKEVTNMFQYLIDHDGKAVMIGVDIYRLTAMHHVEEYLPAEISEIIKSPRLKELYDPDQWFVEDGKAPVKAWYTIQEMAYEKGYIRDGMIGKAKCMLMDIPNVVGLYKEELIKDPYKLYGVTPYVDLHIHSFYSDGTMSPEEILKEAIDKNVGVIAITDHDVLEGSRQLLELCKNSPVQCIPGVELDAIQDEINYHVLGYGVDLNDKLFVERVANNKQLLLEVNVKLIEKMEADYDNISLEDYHAFEYNETLGGWKSLHYFVHKGLANHLLDGFYYYDKYNHTHASVPFPDIKTLCDWIHEAKGKAVLAHPGKVINTADLKGFHNTLLQLVESGIDGIECYYPAHSEEVTSICLNICKQKGLMITSGSDCHGTFQKTSIGQMMTQIDEVDL